MPSLEKTKVPEQRKAKSPFPAVACIMLLAICGVYGVKTYYPEFGPKEISSYLMALKDKVAVSGNGFLSEEKNNLLVENDYTEETNTMQSTEPEELVIESTVVQQPEEMDVVVIPDLDAVVQQPEETPAPSVTEEVVSSEAEEIKGPQEYYIKKGDNLLKILRAYYGNESKLQEVIDLNKIIDPNNIQVGQIILLP